MHLTAGPACVSVTTTRTGTFLQSDPIGFAAGDLNTYAYTFDDPVNWTDPSGMVSTGEWTGVTGRVVGMAGRAVGTIGRGLNSALSGLMNQLSRVFAVADRVDQVATCAGAAASALSGDYAGATQDGVECAAGGFARSGRGRRGGSGQCSFDGATLVLTDEGLRPIEELEAGDLVWSRDEASEQADWRRVLEHYANTYEETVHVAIRDVETGALQTLVSNRIHPIFVQTDRTVMASSEGHVYAGLQADGHWIDAADLAPGDRLLNSDDSWAEVLSVEVVAEPLEAFNLTVEGFNTYFVTATAGADPVWVHNTCGYTRPGRMQREVERGRAPRGVDRVDEGRGEHEQDHVHFGRDGHHAFNRDGTWKHGGTSLSRSQKKWLTDNGWSLPQ